MGRTADDGVKVLQPVLVAVGPDCARQQVVHDDVGVVPQAVGRQEQLPPAAPQHLQQRLQPQVLEGQTMEVPSQGVLSFVLVLNPKRFAPWILSLAMSNLLTSLYLIAVL